MDYKNNVDLINLGTKNSGSIRGVVENSGWGAFGARKGIRVNTKENYGNISDTNQRLRFKTEDSSYLVAIDRQGTGFDNSYKNVCSGPSGNWVYIMNFDTTERNKPECRWKYDKENRTLANEKWPDYCLGPWGVDGQWSLRKCGDGDIVRWVWEDDRNTCNSLGLSLQDCKLSKINDAKKECKKYTDNEICNINDIQKIKDECNTLGIVDSECKKSLIEKIKEYFLENSNTDKSYRLYQNCSNKNISGKECSESLINKCNLYNFNSPGNIKSCNLKTVETHEADCKDIGLELSLCTVDELSAEKNRKVISDGQKIAIDIAQQALEVNKNQSEKFINDVAKILGQEPISNASNIISDSMNLDNNTAILLGLGLIGAYLILSE